MRKSTVTVDQRLLGFESSGNSFLKRTTSVRQAMRASQAKQDSHIVGNELPRIFNGREMDFAQLQLSTSRIPEESILIGLIPKTLSARDAEVTGYTIVYCTNNDLTIRYCDANMYEPLNHGETFGYRNVIQNSHQLVHGRGTHLKKGTEFAVSPAIINGMYCIGTNAKTIYTTQPEVINDGFIISQSLADKLETVGFSRYTISLSRDCYPLNICGTPDDYRILPAIGEQIENEVLFAYRVANKMSCAHDLTMESLQKINHLHDCIYTCPPGAYIVDIKVYIDPGAKLKDDKKYSQFVEINEAQKKYYKEIIHLYNSIKDTEYSLSDEFTALVTHAMGMLKYDTKFKLRFKDNPVDFIECEIVVAYPRKVSAGNKLTDDSAAKGVISENGIWPDDHMPITESGIRADMIIAANSPFNRLIGGPWYSQFINYSSEIITKRLVSGEIPGSEAYTAVLDFKRIVSIEDYNWMLSEIGDDIDKQTQFIEEIKREGMYHKILPFTEGAGSRMIIDVMNRFDIKKENWSYVNPHTGQTVYSEHPTIIGSRYVYLLGKLPEKSVHAVQFGFLNQFNLPMKESNADKQRNPHSHTPIRAGGDETRTIVTSVDAVRYARFMCINGNSLSASKELQHQLLTLKHPSRLFRIPMTVSEMIGDATNIALFRHMLACAGYEIKSERVIDIDEKVFTEYKIPQERKKKGAFHSNIDSPIVERITIRNEIEIDLYSLTDFKVIDNIMKKKLDFGKTQIYFSDGTVCQMTTRVALLHFILWEIYLSFYVIPTKEDLFEFGYIKKNFVSKTYTKIYYRLMDIENHMYVVERLWKNLNYVNRWNDTYLSAHNSTLCAIDIAETLHHPEMKTILDRVPDNSYSVNHIEETLALLTTTLVRDIMSDRIPSTLKQFLQTDSLNLAQVGQFMISLGIRDDIDSKTVRHIIRPSCFEGMETIEDLAVESLSVKKSAFYGKSSIQDAGVFGKYTRNTGDSQVYIYPGHCGDDHTCPIVIKPEWKNGFINRRIVHKGEIVLLNEQNIKDFINVDVDIISAINCIHEFGVCEHCISYGEPGLIKRFITSGANLGGMLSSVITRFISQFILSSKHVQKTNSIIYTLPHEATIFMERVQGGVVWKKTVAESLKKFGMKISIEKMGALDDVQHNIKSPANWSAIDRIELVNMLTGEIVGDFPVNDQVISPYLSNSMLGYMKRVYPRIQMTKDDCIIIPLDEFDFNSTPLKYSLLNKDMRQYVKLVRTFFNNKIELLGKDDVLMEAYNLIYAKNVISSHVVDLVLKAFRDERIVRADGDLKLNFLATGEILKRNIPSKLQHENVGHWITQADTFLKKNTPSCYDIFLGF